MNKDFQFPEVTMPGLPSFLLAEFNVLEAAMIKITAGMPIPSLPSFKDLMDLYVQAANIPVANIPEIPVDQQGVLLRADALPLSSDLLIDNAKNISAPPVDAIINPGPNQEKLNVSSIDTALNRILLATPFPVNFHAIGEKVVAGVSFPSRAIPDLGFPVFDPTAIFKFISLMIKLPLELIKQIVTSLAIPTLPGIQELFGKLAVETGLVIPNPDGSLPSPDKNPVMKLGGCLGTSIFDLLTSLSPF